MGCGGSSESAEAEGSPVAGSGDRAAGSDQPTAGAYKWDGRSLIPAPGIAPVTPGASLVGCSVGGTHALFVDTEGKVGIVGYPFFKADRPASSEKEVALPWPAARVSSGPFLAVVARIGGGAVCTWGATKRGLGRVTEDGDAGKQPVEVTGLPSSESLVALEAGVHYVILVTAADEAYGWGDNFNCQLSLDSCKAIEQPERLEALCGRMISKLACGHVFAAAEAAEGLIAWGTVGPLRADGDMASKAAAPIALASHGVCFPLRDLAAHSFLVAIDAEGCPWRWGRVGEDDREECRRLELPGGERGVRVALGCSEVMVVLSESGTFWDFHFGWKDLNAKYPQHDLRGLAPCGGSSAEYVALVRLCSGGAVLRAAGREFGADTMQMPLCDAGIAAQSAVELLRRPPEGVLPAADGALCVYVRAPNLGRAEALCLEVAPEATVGELAALAAARIDAQQ
eukprot:TRINITY_DN71857_c0_g1_i1.p1 TRINITY_DN71857_c0_g1~~TRINITY_DN71857_c0_g1_i1.p1  ORF type:complete len:455 (+),score=75.16 TRINITY_DN71857_c0_g1_i1:77-1441(+)